jgi:serine/threonine protein kinase
VEEEGDQSRVELVDQLLEEFLARRSRGEDIDIEEYCVRHPDHAPQLREFAEQLRILRSFLPHAGLLSADDPSQAQALDVTEAAPASSSEAVLDPPQSEDAGRFGEFDLVRRIGSGGMGVVWLAEQRSLRRQVAIKFLRSTRERTDEDRDRFKREARLAAGLQHPNIVPIYSAGVESDVAYYAMEYVDGVTLDVIIEALRELVEEGRTEGLLGLPVPLLRSLGIDADRPDEVLRAKLQVQRRSLTHLIERMVPVALALDYSHRSGVVHGDLKPSNLIMDRAGRIRILDFGMAQHLDDPEGDARSRFRGTPRFMSPEQAAGVQVGFSPGVDVYAFGATLYECLTLARIYDGRSPLEILRMVATESPAAPRERNPRIHRDLERVVLKAISRHPRGRYLTMQELAEDLRRFLQHQPIAEVSSARLLFQRWANPRRPLVAMAGALVVASVLLFGTRQWGAWRGGARSIERLQQRLASAGAELENVDSLLGRFDELVGGTPPTDPALGIQSRELFHEVTSALDRASALVLEASRIGREPALVQRARADFDETSLRARVLAHALLGETREAWEIVEAVGDTRGVRVGLETLIAGTAVESRLSVSAVRGFDGRVRLHRVDPSTKARVGEAVAEDDVRLEQVVLLEGDYVIELIDANGHSIEFSWRVSRRDRVEVRVPLLPSGVPAGMRYVAGDPAGLFLIGDELTGQIDRSIGLQSYPVPPAFFMDTHEVTNREFHAFYTSAEYLDIVLEVLDEFRASVPEEDLDRLRWLVPSTWVLGQPSLGTEDHPVYGVYWFQPMAFARWKGKRLPREHEWEYAARGTDSRSFVYGDEFDLTRHFSKEMRAVGSNAGDVSPFGVVDLSGGVREIVEDLNGQSLVIRGGEHRDEEPFAVRVSRRVPFVSPSLSEQIERTKDYRTLIVPGLFGFGFRCAASAPAELEIERLAD